MAAKQASLYHLRCLAEKRRGAVCPDCSQAGRQAREKRRRERGGGASVAVNILIPSSSEGGTRGTRGGKKKKGKVKRK